MARQVRTRTTEQPLSARAAEIAAQLGGTRAVGRKRCESIAREITERRDADCLSALVELLQNQPTAAGAARVLAACGEAAPAMLVPYANLFLELLNRQEDWLVRSAMDSLAWVSKAAPDLLWPRRSELFVAFEEGSPRTRDAAVSILTTLADSSPTRRGHLSPMLLELLRECGAESLPRWAEKVMPALSGRARAEAGRVLAERLDELAPARRLRVEKLLR